MLIKIKVDEIVITYQEFIASIIKERGYHSNYNHKIKGYEIHHIVPKCMGGTNDCTNLVLLNIAEHLVAHTLLFRENQNSKELRTALCFMSNEIGVHKLLDAVDDVNEFNKLVDDIQRAKELHDVSGANNPMFHKHHTEEAKKAMSEKKKAMYVGENNPHWGKKHTEQTKKRISETRMGKDNPSAKKVYCIELNMEFDTIKEALDYVGISNGITQCCNPKYNRQTAGKHPVTKEKLHWKYVENETTFSK